MRASRQIPSDVELPAGRSDGDAGPSFPPPKGVHGVGVVCLARPRGAMFKRERTKLLLSLSLVLLLALQPIMYTRQPRGS